MLRLVPALLALVLVAPSSAAQTTHQVTVQNFSFSPADLTIPAGDAVMWTNAGGFHNVASTGGVESFRNGEPSGDAWTFTRTFTVPGRTDYICDAHPSSMRGSVTTLANTSGEPLTLRGPELELEGPNPTRGRVALRLRLAEPATIRAVVVDVRGREVATLWSGPAQRTTSLGWDASSAAAGVYVVRVSSPDRRDLTASVTIAD